MTPDKKGVWEWFDDDGIKRLVLVCNVAERLGEQRLRVALWGGYYDVTDRTEDIYGCVKGKWVVVEKDVHYSAEWPDRWGNYVGAHGCVPDEQIYEVPTPEQLTKFGRIIQ